MSSEQGSENEDSASDQGGDKCIAAESEDEIVDGTVPQSPMKNRTRIKSRKVVIPEALTCSDSEDELPRPQRRKSNHASPAPLRASGHAKNFLALPTGCIIGILVLPQMSPGGKTCMGSSHIPVFPHIFPSEIVVLELMYAHSVLWYTCSLKALDSCMPLRSLVVQQVLHKAASTKTEKSSDSE